MTPVRGWGEAGEARLGVDSKEAAEDRLRELNYSWEWLDDGCLKATTPPLPAVIEASDGRQVFFNQLIAAFCGWKDQRNDPSKAIRHGDGTPLDTDAVRAAAELAEELAFDLQWQVGDVVLGRQHHRHARATSLRGKTQSRRLTCRNADATSFYAGSLTFTPLDPPEAPPQNPA